MKKQTPKENFKEEFGKISLREEFTAMALAAAIAAPIVGIVASTGLKDIIRTDGPPAIPYCSVLPPDATSPCDPAEPSHP